MSYPKVSVVCVTYNQEKYIQQTLDSFLMQEHDFSVEIIIVDDCSSDNTQEIIKKYALENSSIKAYYNPKNLGVSRNFTKALRYAQGDYIAMCEGDDYWTDKKKIAKQVEYMDQNPSCSVCFHKTRVIFEDNSRDPYTIPANKTSFTTGKLIDNNFMHTSSVMYRRLKAYSSMPTDMLPVDWYLHLKHAKNGKIGYIEDEMSTYRRNKDSVWFSEKDKIDEFWLKRGVQHARMFDEVYKLFANTKYRQRAERVQNHWIQHLIELDAKHNKGILNDLCMKVPEAVSRYLLMSLEENKTLKNDIERRNKQYEAIQSSVVWRTRNMLKKLLKH